jgi:hypothetical protein
MPMKKTAMDFLDGSELSTQPRRALGWRGFFLYPFARFPP